MLISIYMEKKHLIYIILFMIANIIGEYILLKILKMNRMSDYFICYICEICLILFYIIEKYLSKNINKVINENNKKLKEVFILIICYLLFNSISIYLLMDNNIYEVRDYMRMIIFLILIERICSNNYFYSHQILSMIIIIILFLFTLINNIIQSKFKILYLLYYLHNYCYSFTYYLIKYINMKYFINIYLLGFIRGICGLIQCSIQYKPKLPEFNLYNICFIILLFIIMMINYYLGYKIISELGPIHRIMTDLISIYILEIIFHNEFELIVIGLLLIICCLIYLEIIQLNFCNLNKNLKINIANRMIEGIQKDISSFSQYNSELESESESKSELVNRTQD